MPRRATEIQRVFSALTRVSSSLTSFSSSFMDKWLQVAKLPLPPSRSVRGQAIGEAVVAGWCACGSEGCASGVLQWLGLVESRAQASRTADDRPVGEDRCHRQVLCVLPCVDEQSVALGDGRASAGHREGLADAQVRDVH
mmetsp:Transcript_60509/g.179878  ORF Transcript_60509/g.179878 Transcript_60509/m.179878 type:complete len:140 (+) Transcript_60509:1721-2140(+)